MTPDLVPLGLLLEQLVRRHPALQQRMQATLRQTSSPLYAQQPALAAFPAERVAHVRCAVCRGWGRVTVGQPPDDVACAACRGTGLCCPTCRGHRWVLTGRIAGQRALARCPTCPDSVAEQAAILAYLAGDDGEGRVVSG